MDIVWDKEPESAKEISLITAEKIGWNKNTTYTIKKTAGKKWPSTDWTEFYLYFLVQKAEVRKAETQKALWTSCIAALKKPFSPPS